MEGSLFCLQAEISKSLENLDIDRDIGKSLAGLLDQWDEEFDVTVHNFDDKGLSDLSEEHENLAVNLADNLSLASTLTEDSIVKRLPNLKKDVLKTNLSQEIIENQFSSEDEELAIEENDSDKFLHKPICEYFQSHSKDSGNESSLITGSENLSPEVCVVSRSSSSGETPIIYDETLENTCDNDNSTICNDSTQGQEDLNYTFDQTLSSKPENLCNNPSKNNRFSLTKVKSLEFLNKNFEHFKNDLKNRFSSSNNSFSPSENGSNNSSEEIYSTVEPKIRLTNYNISSKFENFETNNRRFDVWLPRLPELPPKSVCDSKRRRSEIFPKNQVPLPVPNYPLRSQKQRNPSQLSTTSTIVSKISRRFSKKFSKFRKMPFLKRVNSMISLTNSAISENSNSNFVQKMPIIPMFCAPIDILHENDVHLELVTTI